MGAGEIEVLEKKHRLSYNESMEEEERRWLPLRADTITKDYLADAVVFADVFNTFIYGGEQVILPQ